MKSINIFLAICFLINLFSTYKSSAQLCKEGTPLSIKMGLDFKDKIPIVEMPSFDANKLRNESNKVDVNNKFLTFAKSFEVELDIKKDGVLDCIDDFGKIWILGVKSKNAYSLNLIFKKYNLSDGAELYVYSSDKRHILGAFTKDNNNPKQNFAIAPVKGDEIIIELFEPNNIEFSSELIIGSVNHDFLNIFKLLKDGLYGNSGDCNRDINCAEGNNWQNEKQSVCRMIIAGSGLCSGSLINNINNNGTAYFLTANHCYSSYSDYNNAVNNTVFYFNYESPTCGGGDGSTAQTISGATLRANWADSDFCLLELSSIPQFNFHPYYSGWFRDNIAPTSATGIHHPIGDVKKICIENNALTSTAYSDNTININANNWRVADWDIGVTEGGSSGSSLYNQNHRIVGQLHGGNAACNGTSDNGQSDWYGKFFNSWAGGGTNTTRLQNWLDPANTTNDLPGLRLIRNATITTTTPVSGDIVRLENVNIQNGSNIGIHINDRFEATGTFNAPLGSALNIIP
jgi:V8-like Glu-specific endopeptidase